MLKYFSFFLIVLLAVFSASTRAKAELTGQEQQMMEEKVTQIQKFFSPGEAQVKMDDEGNITMVLSSLTFDFGQSSVNPKHYTLLDHVEKAVQMFPDRQIQITGHTDAIGSAEFNKRLSQQRANGVKEYLTDQLGIQANRIQVKGAGENEPIASNSTLEGRKLNRRIEVTLLAP
jgi:outer membrane protein OmpA-like peptidoglycan-associated protein